MNRRKLLIGGALTAAAVPIASTVRADAGTAQRSGSMGTVADVPGVLAASTIAASGAWCWFGDPRAVHFEGNRKATYIGYITSAGDIRVAQYDHSTGAWTIGTVATNFQIDDHNTPSIVIRPDRHVVLFWSGHAGAKMYYRRSARAEDVTAWDPVKTVPVNSPGGFGYTYPNPVQLSAEPTKLYLFWRGGNKNPTFSTTSGSDIWTPAANLVLFPNQRPYLKVASNGRDTMHFAFTEGHPGELHSSIYYMYYRAGSLYRADGTRIGPLGTPVSPAQATKVYDATGKPKAWIHDIAVGVDGRPVLTYATFPSNADHRYHYARFTGSGWFVRELVSAGGSISADGSQPNYSGGITLDPDDPNVVLLSRSSSGRFHEIEQWTTADGGASWLTRAITSNSTEPNVRPISPRGLRPTEPLGVIWMAGRYPSYTTYQTRIVTTSIAPPAPPQRQGTAGGISVSWAIGRIDVFGRGGGNHIYHNYYQRGDANGGFPGWAPLAGSAGMICQPVAITQYNGRLDVFAYGSDKRLRQWWFDRLIDGVWHGPGVVGSAATFQGSPAVVTYKPGRIDVFGRDTNNVLRQNYFVHGQRPFGSWATLPGGGILGGDPTVVMWHEGRWDIFGIGTDQRMKHWYFDRLGDSAWHGPENIGTTLFNPASAPSAVSWAPGRIDLFARDTSNQLRHNWVDQHANQRWPNWNTLGTGLISAPTGVSQYNGRLDVFAITTDKKVRQWYFDRLGDGLWHGPGLQADTTFTGNPHTYDVIAWEPGRLDLFAIDTNNAMRHRYYDHPNSWSTGWQQLNGTFQ